MVLDFIRVSCVRLMVCYLLTIAVIRNAFGGTGVTA